MIWGVGLMWALSMALLLKPFIQKKQNLETLDALDQFVLRQGILLCSLMLALYPSWFTAVMTLASLAPKMTLGKNLILLCLSACYQLISTS